MKNRGVRIVVLLSVTAVLVVGVILFNRADDSRQDMKYAELRAASDQKAGVTTQAVSLKLHQLALRTSRGMPLSDGELDWALGLLKNPDTKQPGLLHYAVMSMIMLPHNTTAAQSGKIRAAVLPLLTSPIGLDRNGAVEVLGSLKDKRSIPSMLPLLKDPNPDIREHTREALKQLE